MKTDGIILDIDGTLWNSTPIVAEAWNEIIENREAADTAFWPPAAGHCRYGISISGRKGSL